MSTEKRMWNEAKGGEHWLFIYTPLLLWVVTDVQFAKQGRKEKSSRSPRVILLVNKREK